MRRHRSQVCAKRDAALLPDGPWDTNWKFCLPETRDLEKPGGGGTTEKPAADPHGAKRQQFIEQRASFHCLPISSDTLKASHEDFSICSYRCKITIGNAQNPTITIRDIFSPPLPGAVSFQNQFAIRNCSIQLKDLSLKIFLTLQF